ncbi:hypothetical protein JG688_00007560 [Phytophthora aleatoria]|uniref:Tc1-like transposase DDE domain-containing protein n=1 Tax=Phytophthora aleatoria TaxID=2496075 RepID=A0A8J5IY81_9STRA|nr:hypothetical protein JG688_00007560 [Phytophthora aleatoria]
MYSADFKWRAVTVHYAYAVSCEVVGRVLGVSRRSPVVCTVEETGHILAKERDALPGYPAAVVAFVASYSKDHACFYVEELLAEVKRRFPVQQRGLCASSTAVRVESIAKVAGLLQLPEQLIFLDETSKNGLDSMRRYAWSARGERAVVRVPFKRGNRVSIMATCDVGGYVAWETTQGTFTRKRFHRALVKQAVMNLNPWPLSRSIVIMDNALIHMYK